MLEIRLTLWWQYSSSKWAKIPYIHCKISRVCPQAKMVSETVKRSIQESPDLQHFELPYCSNSNFFRCFHSTLPAV